MLKIIAVVFKTFDICYFYIKVLIIFTPIKFCGLQRSILLFSYYFSVNVTSCFIAFDLLAPKSYWITWHSYLLNISVPDEGHSRNMHHILELSKLQNMYYLRNRKNHPCILMFITGEDVLS
jgi:hypothetical protein